MKIAVLTHNPTNGDVRKSIEKNQYFHGWSKGLSKLELNQIVLIYISKTVNKLQYIMEIENINEDSYDLKLITKLDDKISNQLTYSVLVTHGLKPKTMNYFLDNNESLYKYVTNVLCYELNQLSSFDKYIPCSNKAIAQIKSEDIESKYPEGKEKYKLHRSLERDTSLSRKVKEKRLHEIGELRCDVCNFSFSDTYGELGAGFIEAHHTVPVSELKGKRKTTIDEIALVCSNCHTMIHRSNRLLSIEELQNIIKEKSVSKEDT